MNDPRPTDNPTLQKSEGWHRKRLGKFTSSMVHVFMGEKGAISKTAITYMATKLMELVSGNAKEIKAYSLTHGNDWELTAKWEVARKYNSEYISEIDFIQHPALSYYGGSPDGLICIKGIDTTPEIKCPVYEEHLKNVLYMQSVETLRKEYPAIYWQIQSNCHLQKTCQGLAVTFSELLHGTDLMYKDLIVPYSEADVTLMLERLGIGWEWMQGAAKTLGIDIQAKYLEYSKPLPKMEPLDPSKAFEYAA